MAQLSTVQYRTYQIEAEQDNQHFTMQHSTAQHRSCSSLLDTPLSGAYLRFQPCRAEQSRAQSQESQQNNLIFSPFAGQATNEQLVRAVLHHRPHNLQLIQVYHWIGLSEAQRECHVVVIVVGSAYLHAQKGKVCKHLSSKFGGARLLFGSRKIESYVHAIQVTHAQYCIY